MKPKVAAFLTAHHLEKLDGRMSLHRISANFFIRGDALPSGKFEELRVAVFTAIKDVSGGDAHGVEIRMTDPNGTEEVVFRDRLHIPERTRATDFGTVVAIPNPKVGTYEASLYIDGDFAEILAFDVIEYAPR